MHTIRRARGFAVALLFTYAGTTSCREVAAPSGLGRVAPTRAALAFSSVLPESSGEPVIPLRAARVRLFRLPGEVPERAVLDTVVPFRETDVELALTLGIVVTMVSERFGLELTMIDDQQQVVYRARDTVVAYAPGDAPPTKPVVLRYVGADTAVARISLAVDDTEIPIGEPTPLRASAFLRDGHSTSARFGYAVHGTSVITIDDAGVARASAPVARGSAWIVARIATGLADSIAVTAVVPAESIILGATSGRVDVGERLTLDAIARDAAGAVLPGRRLAWSSSDESIASVTNGVVTARARGTVVITARSGRATAAAAITVAPAKVARVVPSVPEISVVAGRTVGVSVRVEDRDGKPLSGRSVAWSVRDGAIASIAAPAAGSAAVIRGLVAGETVLLVEVDGVGIAIPVSVTNTPVAHVTIVPHALSLVQGDLVTIGAVVADSAGVEQPGRLVGWRSLDPTVASVDGAGVVRARRGGRTDIIASVDGVADTISVLSRRPTVLTITRTATTIDGRGEIVTFLASSYDQFGAMIDNPIAQWSVTQGATLLSGNGPRVEVLLPPNANVVLSAFARGLRADLAVAATIVSQPATPPVSPPITPAPPATPPKRA